MSEAIPNPEAAVARILASIDVNAGLATTRHARVRRSDPCKHCGVSTRWVETTYAAPLHPGQCTDAWDVAYDEAGITRGPWRPMSLIPH